MRIYIKSILVIAVLSLSLAGCKKFGDFGDINKSPNSASDPNTGMLFASTATGVRKIQMNQ